MMHRHRGWLTWILLALTPPIATLAFYYSPVLKTRALPFMPGPDAKLYLYQLARAAEVNGRYWEMSKDISVGQPYPHGVSKHPGFLEGIDYQEVAALTSRWLSPEAAMHLCVIAIMTFNGWVAGYYIFRATGSVFWAMIGAVLIIVNSPTAFRLWGNVHLYKHGYVLLACAAFFDLLDRPGKLKGAWLGFTCALILQGAFYFAFLTALAFAVVFLAFVIQGRIGKPHLGPIVAAGATFGSFALAIAWPIVTMKNPFAAEYFERTLGGVWTFGAELWQYFTPLVIEDPFPGFNYGGANFPGYFILIGGGAYFLARARGWLVANPTTVWVDRLFILAGILTLCSLRGGPGILMFDFVKAFRCFDRAGLIAVGIACVAVPIGIAELVRQTQNVHWRRFAYFAAAGIAVVDVYVDHKVHWSLSGHCYLDREIVDAAQERLMPGWVTWLGQQPPDVKLAAFGNAEAGSYVVDMWHNDSLWYRAKDHHHSTLNGAEYRLFEADLKLLGARPDRMTPSSLRFVVSLGYQTLAFDAGFLKTHPWIDDLPWLEPASDKNGWKIVRTNATFRPYPQAKLAAIVAKFASSDELRIPPATWITERLAIDQNCVVTSPDWATVEWLDESGRRVGKPGAAFGQRVFGPTLPAIRFVSPSKPGKYTLRIKAPGDAFCVDRHYIVDTAMRTDAVAATATPITGELLSLTGDTKLVVKNAADATIRAKVASTRHGGGFEYHPTMNDAEDSVARLAVAWRDGALGPPDSLATIPLPCDLAPNQEISFSVAEHLLAGIGGRPKVRITLENPASAQANAAKPSVAALNLLPESALAARLAAPQPGMDFPPGCVDTVVGDFDGDGRLDLAARHRDTGAWHVRLGKENAGPPQPWCGWSPNCRWGNVVVGDFNGDGKSDLAGRDLDTGAWWVNISNGASFSPAPWGAWSTAVKWSDPIVADFNGDGRADIAGHPVGSQTLYIAHSKPAANRK